LGPRNFCTLQIFKPPSKHLGFYKFRKVSFQEALLGTGLWQYAKMSTSLKSPDGLKDTECKNGQLSHQPPIPYIPVVDVVTPKEEPQLYKVKLPDASHLSIPIYSRENNKEYLAHVVAVLCIIKQKGLPKKCRVLAKAVVRQSKALKILQEAAESRDTISMCLWTLRPARWRLNRCHRCSKKPRRLTQGNCRDVQATEEPAVR
jgi:hypothetical protein